MQNFKLLEKIQSLKFAGKSILPAEIVWKVKKSWLSLQKWHFSSFQTKNGINQGVRWLKMVAYHCCKWFDMPRQLDLLKKKIVQKKCLRPKILTKTFRPLSLLKENGWSNFKIFFISGGFLSDAAWYDKAEKVLLACKGICETLENTPANKRLLLHCCHKYVRMILLVYFRRLAELASEYEMADNCF